MSRQAFPKTSALMLIVTMKMAGGGRISRTQAVKVNARSDDQVKRSVEQVDSVMADPTTQKPVKVFEKQLKADPHLQKHVESAMLDPTLQEQVKLVHECPHCMQMEALGGQKQMAAMRAAPPSFVGLSQSFQPWKPVAAALGSRFRKDRSVTPQALGGNMPRSDYAYKFSSGGRRVLGRPSMMADPDTPDTEAKVREVTIDVAAEDTTMARPGETENAKFICDEGVALWRDFRSDGTTADNLRAVADIVAKYTVPGGPHYSLAAATHWAKHVGRTSYFIANALAGTLAYQAFGEASNSSPVSNASNAMDSKPNSTQRATQNSRGSIGGMGIEGQLASRLVLEAIMVYEQDWKRIVSKEFRPPWDMELGNRQMTLPYALRQSARFIDEAVGTLRRRDRNAPEDRQIWLDAAPELYPDYYKTNFHYQTDGWMSARSAEVYETSTETLFLGKQDAMQRLSLLPLKSLKGRDGKPPRVLEVACGTGRFATFIRDNHPSAELTCHDLSPFYLDKARDNDAYWRQRKAASTGRPEPPPAAFVQSKAEALPFKDGAFDAVVCVYLFHEMPKEARAAAAAEMARVVAPGGTVVLTDSIQRGDRPVLDDQLVNFERLNEPHYRDYICTDISSLFEPHGLVCDKKFFASTSKTLSFKRPAP